ncbi:MAG: HAD-IB family phosphatase, partial [Acidimicrobiales bacterium]
MGDRTSIIVTVTGGDRPDIAGRLFAGLALLGLALLDVEQVQVHGRLLLSVEIEGGPGHVEPVRHALATALAGWLGGGSEDLEVTVAALGAPRQAPEPARRPRQLVTVLAPRLGSGAMAGICHRVATCGGNVDRVVRLAAYPVASYELTVSGADPQRLRRELSAEAARLEVDVAVQRAGLHRRAKHLIVLDADSTLLQGEAIDLLAGRAGCATEVAAVTAAAMAGEIDFAESLSRRLRLLAGTPATALDELADELVLAPGARTLVRTLKRLGYVTAVVSGGFVQVIERVARTLG